MLMSTAQASSPPLIEPDVVPIDDSQRFALKPLIADLVRSRRCVPGAVLLVEGFDAHVELGGQKRAARLLLGDGELCIQALLAPDLHALVDSGQVYAGCYVRLARFYIRKVGLLAEEEGGSARAQDGHLGDRDVEIAIEETRSRPAEMVFIIIKAFETVGWSNVYLAMLGEPPRHTVSFQRRPETPRLQDTATLGGAADSETVGSVIPVTKMPVQPAPGPVPIKTTEAGGGHGSEDDSDAENAFETMEVSEMRLAQRRAELSAHVGRKPPHGELQPLLSSKPIRPHKLTPLRSIPNLPYKQNWAVNVLAVVESLSEVEPSNLPPYVQRTARLVDSTTSKQVHLTVFLDPEAFAPRVGSVVLLLGVKNHRFDGGCLKKYASDRPGGGTDWWIEDPWELDWCDVAGLKAWWDALRVGHSIL
ncbi:hypothetical protein GQ53DRAFT_428935 [Thozetella sp. PMI_491]|nr:hypothetical protein GQ53DRAFT_428935 [Thozetella sp. PMI_491]